MDCLGSSKNPQDLKDAGFHGIDCSIDDWKSHVEWLNDARHLGLTTNAYTIKSESEMIWCAKNALDYVTTDVPMECKHFISQ